VNAKENNISRGNEVKQYRFHCRPRGGAMKDNTQEAAKWDWLADPNAALELYSTERKALYDWQQAEREWSQATRHMDSNTPNESPKERSAALQALKSRLDEAAKKYEQARKKLHEAWSE
jgi:hypothetical protein